MNVPGNSSFKKLLLKKIKTSLFRIMGLEYIYTFFKNMYSFFFGQRKIKVFMAL